MARIYDEELAPQESVRLPAIRSGARSARHLYTAWVDPGRRDRVLSAMQAQGVGVAVNYRAVHLLSYYVETFGFERGAFPNAELLHLGIGDLRANRTTAYRSP